MFRINKQRYFMPVQRTLVALVSESTAETLIASVRVVGREAEGVISALVASSSNDVPFAVARAIRAQIARSPFVAIAPNRI